MTNKLPVPIAVLHSRSAPESKKVLQPEATPMSPSVAPYAAQQKSRAHLEVVVMVAVVLETETTVQPRGKCSR
jgi:hypothetical protein